jgi:peptidoglycan/xylan/chitin deacetylase (PgdA/CDA1 family)
MWETVTAATAVGFAGAASYFSPWLWRQYRMASIRRQVTQNRVLALTYDDGPSSVVTPQLLDLLAQRTARATFFMLGGQAQRYPEIADRIVREGHDVGCHSYAHLNAWKSAPWNALADIRAGYDGLAAWIPPDGMFRPPHGKMTLPTYFALRRRRAPVWWWTIDSGDTHQKMPSSGQIADAVRRQRGGIVLMHDLDRGKERNEFVLETTGALLDVAQRESFKVVTLRELCS